MKIIGIIGSRKRDKFKDYKFILEEFFKIYEVGDWICSGGAPRGGDKFAETIARKNGIPILIFYPNWDKYKDPEGQKKNSAGFMRNTDIAKNSDILIAVVTDGRIGGTEDTITKFSKMGKEDKLIIIYD